MVLLNRTICIFFFYFCGAISLFAQTNSYIIYLTDKQGTHGTFSNPSMYLSARAIEKKNIQNISLDSTDLPVSQNYVDLLKNDGAQIMYTSKWMNVVCIKATPSIYETILTRAFVKNSAPMLKTSGRLNTQTITEVSTTNYTSNFSDFLGITHMHELGITGNDVLIAITDAGFAGVDTLTVFKHLWDNNQIVYNFDVAENNPNVFNDDSHGTYMLSILAANAPNYTSVVPDANYILLRTEISAIESTLEEYNWLRAAEIADSCGVDIISVSLSYTTYDNASESYTYNDMDGSTSIIARAADMAYEKGMIVVCSAGNDGNQAWKYIGTPADAKNVLAIGSVGINNKKSTFSSYGPTADGRIKPNLCALGESIYCYNSAGTLISTGGTSLATPMIAGILAGMKQAYPTVSNDNLKKKLLQICDNFDHPTNLKGYGVPYYPYLYTSKPNIDDYQTQILIAPNPYQSGKLIIKVPESNVEYAIEIFDNQGKLLFNRSMVALNNKIELHEFVDAFSQGIFFISIESTNTRETLKWVKF